jgi:hypothetical protein
MSITAYAEWVAINLHFRKGNGDGDSLVVKNVKLAWGKFYKDGSLQYCMLSVKFSDAWLCFKDKDHEIPVSDVEGHIIKEGETFVIESCGRSDASSGTEGEFDLVSRNKGTTIGHVYWNCPWGSKRNDFTVNSKADGWNVGLDSAPDTDGGALGKVDVSIVHY